MSLLDKIKEDSKKTGSNKGKFVFIKDGDKKRIRFLTDLNDGMEITFHDNFEAGINVPCQEVFGRNCQYCDEEGIRTRSQYAWSVWDYDAAEVKIFMYPMNNCSPIGAICAMYETYGTITDRDYVISVSGKQQNKTFSVVPMDKSKMRNDKAKPFSNKKILEILDAAYPDEHSEYRDDNKKSKKNMSKYIKDEDIEEDEDFESMTPKQLYQYCEDNDIEAEPKMNKEYYLNLIEDAKNDSDDWDEDDNEKDYSSMSPKELYNLCEDRGIEALPKKNAKYYINLLEDDDKSHDDWDDSEDDDWDD